MREVVVQEDGEPFTNQGTSRKQKRQLCQPGCRAHCAGGGNTAWPEEKDSASMEVDKEEAKEGEKKEQRSVSPLPCLFVFAFIFVALNL